MKKDWKNKGTIMTTILHDKIPIPTSPNLISVFLTFLSQAESQRRINVEGLLDTGCLAGYFVARRIIDKVFIMPNIEHTNDSSIPSLLDINIKTPSTFFSNADYERYFSFKNRKYSIEAEYIENVNMLSGMEKVKKNLP